MANEVVVVKSFTRRVDDKVRRKEICRNAANARWDKHRQRIASHRRSKPRRT